MSDVLLTILAIYVLICFLIILAWLEWEVREWAKLFLVPFAIIIGIALLPFQLIKLILKKEDL